jgi:hypothetical protein
MMTDPQQIEREAQAAKALRDSIAELRAGHEDEDLAIDMIEGETGLFECIDALLAANTADVAMVTGIEKVAADLDGRRRRVEARIATRRALIEQAMLTAEIKNVERPAATLTMANRAPSVVTIDEADIPARFWTAGAPKLDRKALAEALRSGEPVPGAHLSNAAPTLSVRTK